MATFFMYRTGGKFQIIEQRGTKQAVKAHHHLQRVIFELVVVIKSLKNRVKSYKKII